jgi:hypothetical protein
MTSGMLIFLLQIYVLLLAISPCRGFHVFTTVRLYQTRLFAFNVESASTKLLWETFNESSSKPVLDLSVREASSEATSNPALDSSEWDQGQRWKVTEQGLKDMGVRTESFLEACPQLLRLETKLVLETADWVIQEFSPEYLQSEPRLISSPMTDVSYGLEFMSLMMMSAKAACRAAPALLLAGIEGGLQEQAVTKALGQAGDATQQANQKIAGDAAASLNELKKRRGL